jgi:lipase chaperone LimK
MNIDAKPRWFAGAAALVLLGAVAWWWSGGEANDSSDPTVADAASIAPLAAPMPMASDAMSPAVVALGGGLEETARMFELGVAGHLRLDMDTKAALELTLAQLGPNPSAEDIARVENSLRKGLPAAAAQQAIALVHGYRAYSQAYARDFGNAPPPGSLAELRAQLDRQEALQRRHFDPQTAQALFGAQIAHSRYMLEAQTIETDTQLSTAERAQRIEALRQRMPPEVAALEDGGMSQAERDMQRQVNELRARGGSEDEVQRVRSQVLGSEGAQALAQQEQQRAQFESRFQAYLQEKRALSTPTTAQIDALLSKHFPPDEQASARAYERLQAR